MKLRIKGNSIRLRLSQTDLEAIAERGFCEEQTVFPGRVLKYRLALKEQDDLTTHFQDELIELQFPNSKFEPWFKTEQVGLENTFIVGSQELNLLVEKDWQCLSPRNEDESDLFANPNATKATSILSLIHI